MSKIDSRFLYNIFNKIDKFAAVITLRKKSSFLGKSKIGNSLNYCIDVHVTVQGFALYTLFLYTLY